MSKIVKRQPLSNMIAERDRMIANTDQESIETFLTALVAAKLDIPESTIDTTSGYYELGLDSPALLEMALSLEKYLSTTLSPTLLFEYTTITTLAAYLVKIHVVPVSTLDIPKAQTGIKVSPHLDVEIGTHARIKKPTIITSSKITDIAIIGIAGRYPMAKNMDEFWENLLQGRNCVTDIPIERWDKNCFNHLKSPSGKSLSTWGGFIDDVDKFDPLFFNISPREAEAMDPQERLFLEVCWHAMEDAGYTPQNIVTPRGNNNGMPVGVFVGVMHKDYAFLQAEAVQQGVVSTLSLNYAQIANRVSYFCSFNGPSMAIDTVCSSSLTAIHLAIESILRKECQVALAGGVNLSLHSNKYLTYGMADLHASDGLCRTFGEGGDGYVSSEGVGAILLKPLNQALIDGDHIYAVIKGSSVNHVGKASGFTVPSLTAQGDMILECLEKTGIHPETISYIETHGTGTSLGDPIEIAGLNQAFQKFTDKKQFCALGSVKSNIGHAESAAGISGLTKAVLQLKYKTLVKSLHSEKINPYLKLEHSPFYVQSTTETWESTQPRRSGISSFGATGSNAHIILEEAPAQTFKIINKPYFVITLSGKMVEALKQRQVDLLAWLNDGENKSIPLNIISYTLNQGRSHFNHRVALVVDNKETLKTELEKSIANKESDHSFAGIIDKNSKPEDDAIYTQVLKNSLAELHEAITNKKAYREILLALANLYVKGYSIDWELLHQGEPKQRISLPTYPFAKDRYWVPSLTKVQFNQEEKTERLHPLVHSNVSNLSEQRFTTLLNSNVFYLADHVINDHQLLPGVAYLEMARAAGILSLEDKQIIAIENIVWSQPIVVDSESQKITIALYPKDDVVMFEVRSHIDSAEIVVHSQGQLLLSSNKVPALNDLSESIEIISSRCEKILLHDEIYQAFAQVQFNYGSSFQTLEWIKIGKDEVLGKLQLSEAISDADDRDQYVLHPALLDGALQSIMGFALSAQSQERHLPFALDRIELFETLPNSCYVHARRGALRGEVQRYDLDILNEAGVLCVRLRGFSTRALSIQSPEIPALHFYRPEWQVSSFLESAIAPMHSLLIFSQEQALITLLKHELEKQQENLLLIQIEFGEMYQVKDQTHYQLALGRKEDYEALFRDLDQAYPNTQWSHIVDLWPNESSADVTKNTLHLLSLTQVLLAKKISSVNLLHLYSYKENQFNVHEMHTGFALSLRQENPNYHYKIIGVDEKNVPAEKLSTLILKEFSQEVDHSNSQLRYVNDQRFVKHLVPVLLKETDADAYSKTKLREQGVYLITGGLGGLGLIFASYLAKNYQAKLILTGRSKLKKAKKTILDELKDLGGEAIYISCDISDYHSTKEMIKQGEAHFGRLNGVIHSAGVLKDSFILKKTPGEVKAVFLPKIDGLINLDKLTQDNKELDFFSVCSSIVGMFGYIGQSDYASANAFMDAFIEHRDDLQKMKKRYGKSISINWPLWKNGGMQIDIRLTKLALTFFSIELFDTEIGIDAFCRILLSDQSQVMPVFAQRTVFERKLMQHLCEVPAIQKNKDNFKQAIVLFQDQVSAYLQAIIAKTLNLEKSRLQVNEPFETYGIDSILTLQLINALEKEFGALPKTLLFEYQNLSALTEYFLTHYAQKWEKLFSRESFSKPNFITSTYANQLPHLTSYARSRFISEKKIHSTTNDEIAIIGVSGRYPMAKDIAVLWENLKAGKDCVIEVPGERWDYRQYYDGDRHNSTGTYSKWGSFLEDFDKFDPLFFNISPKEAETMDPQERLFLETAWKAIEDAGYSAETLSTSLGVFVGVMYSQAQEMLLSGQSSVAMTSPLSSIANRVSYYLNSHGPSVAIDTMCSSSLTSIHFACESIRRQECQMALAGGVNISSHANKYVMLSQGQFLSSDGKCRSFGEGGDGYVPGEGVGAILLKSLCQAQQDGDPIYGTIKASSINHGGKTNGYTVPNPVAQSDLIEQTLEKAKINPRTISYIEAHGTGTSLGDPIELRGLTKAFEHSTKDKQFCSIGSIKSNLGHCESAAGIVSVTKVLLQMQHKQLVPTLHSETINPNLNLEHSSFYLQHELNDWNQPEIEENGRKKTYPRRAGISSFGAGGSNAHVIIEEAPEQILTTIDKPYFVIMLSGKTAEALRQRQMDLLNWLNNENNTDIPLNVISYTLNQGRSHFIHRAAWVIDTKEALRNELEKAIANKKTDNSFFGIVNKNDKPEDDAIYTQVLKNSLAELNKVITNNKAYREILLALANLYIKGYLIDWELLHQGEPKQRISLPTYPFAKEHYWVSQPKINNQYQIAMSLHPLVHCNNSNLLEQYFSTTFEGHVFYLNDHQINEHKILPGVAYLEMARAAGILSLPRQQVVAIENVIWSQPIIVDSENQKITIALYPKDDVVLFEVRSNTNDEEPIVHSQGQLLLSDNETSEKPQALELIENISARCEKTIAHDEIYQAFSHAQFNYGLSFQTLEWLKIGKDEVLGKLQLSDKTMNATDRDQYYLHPALLDGALQSIMGFALSIESQERHLPFALDRIELFEVLPNHCYVHAKRRELGGEVQRYDLDVLSKAGELCVRLTGFSTRAQKTSYLMDTKKKKSDSIEKLYRLIPVWNTIESTSFQEKSSLKDKRILLISENKTSYKKLNNHFSSITQLALPMDISIEALTQQLSGLTFDHLVWIAPEETNSDDILLDQSRGVLQFFNLVKAWLNLGFSAKILELTAIVYNTQLVHMRDNIQSAYASMVGFIGSLAKEYSQWKIRLLDLQSSDDLSQESCFLTSLNSQGTCLAYRNQQWFEQKLINLNCDVPNKTSYRQGGVYVVIGGAGGLGRVWTQYVIQHYQATVIWIGRRKLDATIQSYLDACSAFGKTPLYISADAANHKSLRAVYRKIKKEYSTIHGVVHAAIDLQDQSIANMQIKQLEKSLRAKIETSVNLERVFGQEALDFIVFFSSLMSFAKSAGQANYAAGCTFIDSFAHSLRKKYSYPIKIMNWGYWGDVGIVSDNFYKQKMKKIGIGSIEAQEGMEELNILLGLEKPQIAVIKTLKPEILAKFDFYSEEVCTYYFDS